MIRLALTLTAVSLVVVPLLLGLLLAWSLLMMLVGSGIMGAPDWPFVLYVVYGPVLEWFCASAVNGSIARKWFPHVRGGLLVAAGVPAFMAILGAGAALLAFGPIGGHWRAPATMSASSFLPFTGGGIDGAPLVRQASVGAQSEMIGSLVVLMVFAFGGLTIISAGTAAVLLLLIRVLPGRKWRHKDAAVRLASVEGHRDRAVLRWVAAHDQDSAVRDTASRRLALL